MLFIYKNHLANKILVMFTSVFFLLKTSVFFILNELVSTN